MKKQRTFSVFALVVLVASLLAACAKTAPAVVEPEATATTVVEVATQPQTEVEVKIQTKFDPTPRLAIMAAVEQEFLLLLSLAEIEDTKEIAGTVYHLGRLAGNDVVMFLSGMSMTNATMTAQAVIDYFQLDGIVFFGIAGGINPNLNIGDVTVPTWWGEYLDFWYARETSPGVFELPPWVEQVYPDYFPGYNGIFPRNLQVVREGEPELKSVFWFGADPEMLAVARMVANRVELQKCVEDGECLPVEPKIVVGGNGVSGPAFVDNKEFREYVWDTFQANALDTESAAVAHVAYANNVPFIAFRSLSDLAGGDLGDNVVFTFFDLATNNSTNFVLAFLEAWASGERPEPIEACFVYVGPVGDHGWTYAHDLGRQYLEANAFNVETTYLESVSDVDSEARIRDLAEQGCDVIFTTSASFRDSTAVVAPGYPGVIFENCSGFLTDENMGSYFGRMYQAKYLAGIVAGMTTESNEIGYVAPIQIPEIIRLINGVALGARSVNPDVEVEVVWIDNWFDPPAETAAVNSMVDAGVDVIFTGTDTTVPVSTADERGVWSVGYDSCESCDAAPDMCLTTPCWNWGLIYVDIVEAVRDGTWSPDTIYRPMSEGTVVLTEVGPAAAEGSQEVVDEARASIDAGQDVFCGPLYDNHGELRVAEGECMTDMELICFDWYVEGVNSEVPEGVGCN